MNLKVAINKFKKADDLENWCDAVTLMYRENHKNIKYLLDFRKHMTQRAKEGENVLDYVRKSYVATAPFIFDDFMIALEWDRPPAERYWLPRREKLMGACQSLQQMEDGELDELFLSMPPRVGKSTLMVFFMLWIILRDSERSNLYCSYTDSVVNVFYNGLIEILSDEVTYRWKDVFPKSAVVSTNAKDLLLNIDRRKRYASFTGRSLYGTLNGACDCSGYTIADDLISGIEEAMNKDRLNSAWFKVDNNYLPRAKEGAKRLWIGTRWSLSDPIGRRIELLENDDRFKNVRYKVISFPALDEHDESNFLYPYNVGFSTDYYHQRRASFERNNDMASWLAQYMQEPIERNGSVFLPEDLRFYNGVLPSDTPDRVFMAVDPAFGGGDYTAAPVCYQYGRDLYVADVVYDNGDKYITIPLLVNAIKKHGVNAVFVEATKMTSSYTEELNEKLKEQDIRVNVQSSIKHFTSNGKVLRIFDKAPEIRESMVFLNKRSKSYELFMQNVYSFTVEGKNKHDDAPDSLAMAIYHAFDYGNTVAVGRRLW